MSPMGRAPALPPTLLVVVTLSFFMLRAAPGGPFNLEKPLEPQVTANLRELYRLDDPLCRQDLTYLGALLHGDLGPTYFEAIAKRLKRKLITRRRRRYVAAQRLKRLGVRWRAKQAEFMLALRISRISGDWSACWNTLGSTALPEADRNRPQHSQTSAA